LIQLRADPWLPEFGMGVEFLLEEEEASADSTVERDDWSRPISPPTPSSTRMWFIDGVRRVELRVLADEDERHAFGLFGSFAVGAVRCDKRAEFADHEIGRALVLGSGLRPRPVAVPCGGGTLAFEPQSEPGTLPDRPLWCLQQLMRRSEALISARVAAAAEDVVVSDGPLTYTDPTTCPLVGMIKRFARLYIGPNEVRLLALLRPGQRTPLFALHGRGGAAHRYSWYARVASLSGPWHVYAGLVRCEIRAAVGLDAAVGVANRVTALLPGYAGRASDPRTPQNLAPIAGAEAWLRHRMGHPALIRRALLEHLSLVGAAAA